MNAQDTNRQQRPPHPHTTSTWYIKCLCIAAGRAGPGPAKRLARPGVHGIESSGATLQSSVLTANSAEERSVRARLCSVGKGEAVSVARNHSPALSPKGPGTRPCPSRVTPLVTLRDNPVSPQLGPTRVRPQMQHPVCFYPQYGRK